MYPFIFKFKLSIIISIFINFSLQWNPSSLYSYFLSTTNKTESEEKISTKIIDPDKYINNKKEMYEKILTIEKKYNISLIFIVIDKIDDLFKKENKHGIAYEVFTTKFEYLYYKKNNTKAENAMTILFSIKNRKNRINTGKNVRKIFSDDDCLDLLISLKSVMQTGNYNKGFIKLLNNIYDFEKFIKSKKDRQKIGLIITLIFFLVAISFASTVAFITTIKQKHNDERMSKINKITNRLKSKNIKIIFAETCVICLNDFEDFKNDKKKENPNSEIIKIKSPKNKRFTMSCGHQFHKKCIEKWLKKNSNCPICREKIRDDCKPEAFKKNLINVQRVIFPHFYYNTYNSYNDYGGRSYSSSSMGDFGGGGGGATCGW